MKPSGVEYINKHKRGANSLSVQSITIHCGPVLHETPQDIQVILLNNLV